MAIILPYVRIIAYIIISLSGMYMTWLLRPVFRAKGVYPFVKTFAILAMSLSIWSFMIIAVILQVDNIWTFPARNWITIPTILLSIDMVYLAWRVHNKHSEFLDWVGSND